MKRILLTTFAWVLIGYAVVLSSADKSLNGQNTIRNIRIEPMRDNNLGSDGSGWIIITADTTTLASRDTTGPLEGANFGIPSSRWSRLFFNYRWRLFDANLVEPVEGSGMDSIGAKFYYQWSVDGVSWTTKDSSASIIDTLKHTDTIPIYSLFDQVRIVARKETGVKLEPLLIKQVCDFRLYPIYGPN